MTASKSALALALCMLFLLFGCSSSSETNNDRVIASAKTLPSNFYELAYEREETPFFQYLVRKAVDQAGFEQLWSLYGFEDKAPGVSFSEKEVIFIGVQESGSCPYKLDDVELSSNNKTLIVPLLGPQGTCTSDATPRTFVIQMDKETSNAIENIVIVQSGVETNVPFK